jgi:hypothetical protein
MTNKPLTVHMNLKVHTAPFAAASTGNAMHQYATTHTPPNRSTGNGHLTECESMT